MTAILRMILDAFAGTLLDAFADAFSDWQNTRTHQQLGAARQREKDMRLENERLDRAAAAARDPDRLRSVHRSFDRDRKQPAADLP